MGLEVAIGVAIGGLLILFFLFKRKPAPLHRVIPGLPSSSAINGNLEELAACGTFQRFLTKYHHRYGSIFSFWYGKLYAVSLSDPRYVKCVGHLLAHHPVQTEAIEIFLNKKAMASVSGPEWKRRRRLYWDPAFGPKAVSLRQGLIEAIISTTYLPEWNSLAANGAAIETRSYFLRMSIRVIYEFSLGEVIANDEIEAIFHPTKEMWSLLEKKIHGTASDAEVQNFTSSCDKIRAICEDIIKNRKRTPHAQELFIDYVLKDADPEVVYADVAAALLGGIHATSTMLVWSLYYLARYPEQQEKIAREVGGAQGVVSAEIAQNSTSLNEFTDEVLRLSLLTTFIQRINDGPAISLPDGYSIPTGALVYLNLETILWSSAFYQNPCEFNPARFHDPEARSLTQFFPFSFLGGRSCPGKWLALQEVSICLATLVRQFYIEFHPTQVLPVETMASFFNHPKQEILIRLKRRD